MRWFAAFFLLLFVGSSANAATVTVFYAEGAQTFTFDGNSCYTFLDLVEGIEGLRLEGCPLEELDESVTELHFRRISDHGLVVIPVQIAVDKGPEPSPYEKRTQAIDRIAAVLEKIFEVPAGSELAALWSIGFTMPLFLYLVAFGVGSLVNFWRR